MSEAPLKREIKGLDDGKSSEHKIAIVIFDVLI